MKRACTTAVIAFAALFGSASVEASPSGARLATGQPPADASLVQNVHGCHRSAQDSYEGWHRHVGPYCDWVPAPRAYRNPYARCRTVCKYVGPIKTCRRECW